MTENQFADGCAYVEGSYYPIADARISIVDTGFTRSDLTYDVVAVWNGKFFRLDEHLNRFQRSWKQLRLQPAEPHGAYVYCFYSLFTSLFPIEFFVT